MFTLHHAIKILAPRSKVYRALTDMDEMAAWHLGGIEGEIAPGKTMTLTPKPGMRFGWRTETLEPDTRVVQICVEGSGTSPGKVVTFKLSDGDESHTLLELTDGEWHDDDPHRSFCNTRWGQVLHNVKAYVEQA